MLPTTDQEKRELVELARLTWGEEIARLLAEDLGLVPKPPPEDERTIH